MKIQIIIATHKKYWMPEDKLYLPLHVGAKGKYANSSYYLKILLGGSKNAL